MHPELQGLLDRYDALLSAVEAGQMAAADAIATLAALKVVDGQGSQWSLTPEGQFMRGTPGGPSLPADPHAFAPPTLMPPPLGLPGTAGAVVSSPWDVTPPAVGMPPLPRPGDPLFPYEPDPAPAGPSRSLLDRLLATKPWRNRTFLVIVACLLAGGLILMARAGSSADPGAGSPAPAPSVVPNSVTSSQAAASPGTAEPSTPAEALAAALAAGDLTSLSGMSSSKSYPGLVMLAAQVRGSRDLGVTVDVVPGEGQVKVSFTDAGQVLARATVLLTRKGVVKSVSAS